MTAQSTSINRQDYLKAILSLELSGVKISTSAIASKLKTQPASVTGMLKVLAENGLIRYEPYKGAELTVEGRNFAISIVRKHRLWETFMFEHLDFGWEQVHSVAEQLEHIDSDLLIDKLDEFMGHPRFDPHGDPIPDASGNFHDARSLIGVSALSIGDTAIIKGLLENSDSFLKHLVQLEVRLGLEITVIECFGFDGSMKVSFMDKNESLKEVIWSKKLVKELLVEVKNLKSC